MKVLLATQDFPPVEGGMAQFYASLAGGFPRDRLIVSTTADEGPAPAAPGRFPIERESFPMSRAHRPLNGFRWSRHLEGLIRRERPGILLCGNIRPLGPICWQLHRRLGIPYVVIVHGNDILAAHRHWSGWRRPLWNAVTKDAALWMSNSRAVSEMAVGICGLDPAKSAILHPEVDTDRFHPVTPAERSAIRRELGLPDDGPVVLFVGRLVARKGLDRLLEALARIGTKRPWNLAVAGYGDASSYATIAERNGLAERVRFLGAVSARDLPRVFAAADIFAMPSRTLESRGDVEGFGIVYLEAAATGVPALAGRSGGAPEAVEDGVTGFVADGESVESIASALDRLIADETLRINLGGAGRRRAVDEFGAGSMARRCLEHLDRRLRLT